MSEAWVFPGQGAQESGMGRDLYEQFAVARELYDRADLILGRSISRLCFEGSAEDLGQTFNSQPAIFVTSMALLEVAREQDLVRAEIARPAAVQLSEGMAAYGDFLFSGTAARYFLAAWPYGAFFAVPLLNVLLFTAVAIAAGLALAQGLASYGEAIADVAGFALALAVFAILMRTLGQR